MPSFLAPCGHRATIKHGLEFSKLPFYHKYHSGNTVEFAGTNARSVAPVVAHSYCALEEPGPRPQSEQRHCFLGSRSSGPLCKGLLPVFLCCRFGTQALNY
jgi:hypothetical protein